MQNDVTELVQLYATPGVEPFAGADSSTASSPLFMPDARYPDGPRGVIVVDAVPPTATITSRAETAPSAAVVHVAEPVPVPVNAPTNVVGFAGPRSSNRHEPVKLPPPIVTV